MSRDEQVRDEIEMFLAAVNSYPDRFARNPQITFEEHRSRLIEAAEECPRRRVLLKVS